VGALIRAGAGGQVSGECRCEWGGAVLSTNGRGRLIQCPCVMKAKPAATLAIGFVPPERPQDPLKDDDL
jgi:hypothetical protein